MSMSLAEQLAASKQAKGLQGEDAVLGQYKPKWETTLESERVRLKLSVSEVARTIGLSTPGLIRIEKGVSDPRVSTARLLAAFYGKPIESLWVREV
jgi:DNA-binding XRE family transcriptional regulator